MIEIVYFPDKKRSPCVHSDAYVAKHIALFKEDCRCLKLMDEKILQNLELAANMQNPDPIIRAGHHLLWGMFHYQDGDVLQGYHFLLEAERILRLTHQSSGDSIPKNDLFSYVLAEIASVFYVLFDTKNTKQYINQAQSFALSEHLKIITNTYEQAFWQIRFYMDVIHRDLDAYEENLEYMRKHELHYSLAKSLYLRMGITISFDLLDTTFDSYFEGMALSKKLNLDTYQSGFHLALGLWYAKNKEWQKALKCYQEAYDMTESHYRQTLCLENTASLYERYDPSHSKRIEALMKMLEKCEKHNLIQKIPVVCLYLSHYHRVKKEDLETAMYYMKKGYDVAMAMQDQGIHLFARSARIVKEYPEFMEKYYLPWLEGNKRPPDKHEMPFCLDANWQDCKNTFQYSLIIYHLARCNKLNDFLNHLDLKLYTFQGIRKKLINAGFNIPDLRFGHAAMKTIELDPKIVEYCESITTLNWKNANFHFQKDALTSLLKHHDNNKMQLSKQLNISYPTMIRMIKDVQNSSLPSPKPAPDQTP